MLAEAFHRLTAYAADRPWLEPVDDDRVRQDFIPLMPEERPPPFKEYPEHLQRITLPDVAGAPVAAARLLSDSGSVDSAAGRTPSIGDLAVTLARCAGVRKHSARSGEYFRAASSAGNRHPYEVYVSARGVDGLADGVWHYDARAHAVTRIGPPAAGDVATLVITGVPWRSCWRYSERGYRHVGWDCGTVAAHAVLAASTQGLTARVQTAFDDAVVSSLVGARDREEFPMLLVPLADGVPAVTPGGDSAQGDLGAGAEEFPLVAAIHEAGNLCGEHEVAAWDRRRVVRDPGVRATAQVPDEVGDEALELLVSRRRSVRRLDDTAVVSPVAARWIIDVASAPMPGDAGTLHEVRVVAHGVEGLEPGVYRPASGALERTASSSRAATFRACLDQEAGRDAAAVIFLTPAPGPTIAPDARTYRASLLSAGYALGRIYLAVAALRLDCSGLTFVDSELPATIGVRDALAVIAVGVRR
ncbi:nitroreductase family protein [Micromonospora sp. CPCC 205558]|uniref:nitroreductase family protein n=1 Tax=Micromonospora sp. CPCC 205558 TaxID=3122403 RepID=UPI002FF3FCCC